MREKEAAFWGFGHLVLDKAYSLKLFATVLVVVGCCYAVEISAFFYLLQRGNHFLSSGLAMLMSSWKTPLLLYLSRIMKPIVICRLQQNCLAGACVVVNLRDFPKLPSLFTVFHCSVTAGNR